MSAVDLQAIAEDVAAALTRAGLRTVIDPADLTPPCAILGPRTLALPTLGDSAEATWDLYLVAPDNGRPLATLSPLVEALRASGMLPDSAELSYQGVTFQNLSPDPLPCLTAVLTTLTR